MCDQGQTLTFDSQECKIKKTNSGKLVAKVIRTLNNVYNPNEINGENFSWGRKMKDGCGTKECTI
jgi:hypothetical protein